MNKDKRRSAPARSLTQERRFKFPWKMLLLIASLAVLSGCVIIGDKLDQFKKRFYTLPVWVFDNARGYVRHPAPAGMLDDDVNVVLAISGGGTRASYFSACVMEQLAAMPDPSGKKGSLLERVQVVSGVSGGSLAAMFYANYKPAKMTDSARCTFFQKYKYAMSFDQVMGGIAHFENNLWEFGLYYYTRWRVSQTLAQMYDRNIFRRATFGSQHARALKGEAPVVVIPATNLDTGGKFLFSALGSQEYFSSNVDAVKRNAPKLATLARVMNMSVNLPSGFDTIDTEPDNFRLSVAVAASSGLPNTPGPTTLVNYATNGYVHLADGGINDNTGIDPLVQLYLNARCRGKHGRLVIIAIDAMQGIDSARRNDRDPDGYVGSLAYASHAFATASERTQIFQESLLAAASPDIKTVRLRLFDDRDADLKLSGRGPSGIGILLSADDLRTIEQAAANIVAQNASRLNRAVGGR